MKQALLSESDRERHTYITGSSGSGKTELLKVLLHPYVMKADCAAVILDPHGDLAQQVARWQAFEHNDRLVYVDPFLRQDHTPVINPFQANDPNDEFEVDKLSQELCHVFKELMKGADLTMNMETILIPCIATIIRCGGDLIELQRMMDDDNNEDLIRLAKKSPNFAHRNLFNNAFQKDTYKNTKAGIFTRIQNLLNTMAFYRLISGRSTVNLKQAIDDKKIIIFNLSKGVLGRDASDAFGRFITAMLQSIALQQATLPESNRMKVHFFIDECQNYISESIEGILTESRKYGLHLTLAQQYLGQKMDAALTKAVLGNTEIKITGKNASSTIKTMSELSRTRLEDFQALKMGVFNVYSESTGSVFFKSPTHLLGFKGSMAKEAWQQVKKQQLDRYYKSLHADEANDQNDYQKSEQTAGTSKSAPKYTLDF